MKKFLILAFLILFVFLAGCTDTTPPAEPVAPQTQVQTPVVTATPRQWLRLPSQTPCLSKV